MILFRRYKKRKHEVSYKKLIMCTLCFLSFCSQKIGRTKYYDSTYVVDTIGASSLQASINECELRRIKILQVALGQEINRYIKDNFPNSKLNGHQLAKVCLEYNMDPIFVMAQAQIESGFGTQGTAKTTNSVWNVGAYDGHSASQQIANGHGYSHPDHSLVPYINLLKTKYLIKNRTTKDLMRNYVNSGGHRYATNINYEQDLSSTYNLIKRKTKIYNLYKSL